MRRNQSSLTAMGIAINRAFESSRPPGERICFDPFARRFVNPVLYHLFALFISTGYAEWRGPGVQAFLAARERYIDDLLQANLDSGLEQLVILGAGLDSRAYRVGMPERGLPVYEVDHPATQQVKLDRVKTIFGAVPGHVTFVPIDFNTQTLEGQLRASGHDPLLRTLFIWQGVTMYLTAEAVDSTLAFIACDSAAGSSVVFDYICASALSAGRKRGEVASMQRYRGLTGEGLTFGIEEGQIREFLALRGFDHIKNVRAEDLRQLYLKGPNARRQIAPIYAIVSASVSFESAPGIQIGADQIEHGESILEALFDVRTCMAIMTL